MKYLDISAAREGFFFYLLENKHDRQELFTKYLQQRSARKAVLTEIVDVGLLVENNDNHPHFPAATNYWVHRLAMNGIPAKLMTDEGMKAYYDYLALSVNPTLSELEQVLNRD